MPPLMFFLRDPRDLVPHPMVRAEAAFGESILDSSCPKLDPSAGFDVAREQSHDGVIPLPEGVEQIDDPGQDTGPVRLRQAPLQALHITAEQGCRIPFEIIEREPGFAGQILDDQGIRPAAVGDAAGDGVHSGHTEHRLEGLAEALPAGAVRQEQCPVDVEQDEALFTHETIIMAGSRGFDPSRRKDEMEIEVRIQQVERRPDEVRTPGEPFEEAQRILLVRNDRLGDVILTIPAVAAFRQAYPDAELIWAVRGSIAPVARHVVGPDRILELPDDVAGMNRLLAAERPDVLVALSRDKELAWGARYSRARHRLGTGRRFFAPLFTRRVDEPRREGGRHEVEYALAFAHRAGAVGGPATFDFAPDAPFMVDRGAPETVVVHPGSGGSCPRWEMTHYEELVRRLESNGIPVAISTGPGEEPMARRLQNDLDGLGVRFLAGDLVELAGELRQARLVISNSTGPLHLAAALGTPTLAIHAPWSSCAVERWGPYAANGWAITAWNEDALDWDHTTRRRKNRALMSALAVEAVESVVRQLLDGEDPRRPG